MIVYLAAVLFRLEEFAFGEDRQVFGDGGAGRVEVGGDGAGRHCLGGYQQEDGSPGGVGDGLENVASYFHRVAICLQIYV